MRGLGVVDPSSFSRPELALVTDITIVLAVHFDKKIFNGHVNLVVKKIDPTIKEVILDTNNLKIFTIKESELNVPMKYEIGPPVKEYGSKLTIDLPKKEGEIYNICIHYETDPGALGLQWLHPNQTAGKKHPYVFSQFQPTHARSFLPCQDTPYVKTTYSAMITSPKALTVVMSAPRESHTTKNDVIVYNFYQKVPIPSYLIALAIGAIESRQIGPRSHVWAEKENIEDAAYEFALTENQLQKAEEICGPYVWGIYDLLVLPPSFPYGGMENPCLTFVTPTLLAGDRSLANVVAHEIAHSWTGNLITNTNFEHFWLNEGFTVFIERKIFGRLTSLEEQDFDAYCGRTELKETIAELGPDNPRTCLVTNLENMHPDEAFSRVPYEKGHIFLRFLELLVGGPPIFEPFLREYFDTYKYKSIDSNEFKKFFNNYFKDNPVIEKIDWDTWLHKPGMPPVIPIYDESLLDVCLDLKKRWLEWNETKEAAPFRKPNIKKLSTNLIIQLLQEITDSEPQPIAKLIAADEIFEFSSVKNAEIKFRWLKIGLKAHWEDQIVPTLEWINEVGRMKFVRPLYRALYDWDDAREKAIENFKKQRHTMMHVSAFTVSKDLHL